VEIVSENNQSPIIKEAIASNPITMTFYEALKKAITDGVKITKIEWADKRSYGLMKDGILQLHKSGEPKNKLHPWILNDGDILGIDWIIIKDEN
jgi:hypothetical protein